MTESCLLDCLVAMKHVMRHTVIALTLLLSLGGISCDSVELSPGTDHNGTRTSLVSATLHEQCALIRHTVEPRHESNSPCRLVPDTPGGYRAFHTYYNLFCSANALHESTETLLDVLADGLVPSDTVDALLSITATLLQAQLAFVDSVELDRLGADPVVYAHAARLSKLTRGWLRALEGACAPPTPPLRRVDQS